MCNLTTDLGAQVQGVDVASSRRRHLPLEVQSEEVGQEVTCRQTGAEVQSSLAHIQTQRRVREALQ